MRLFSWLLLATLAIAYPLQPDNGSKTSEFVPIYGNSYPNEDYPSFQDPQALAYSTIAQSSAPSNTSLLDFIYYNSDLHWNVYSSTIREPDPFTEDGNLEQDRIEELYRMHIHEPLPARKLSKTHAAQQFPDHVHIQHSARSARSLPAVEETTTTTTTTQEPYKPYPTNQRPYQFLHVLEPAERPYFGLPRWQAWLFYFLQGMSLTPNLDWRMETDYVQDYANVPSMQLATYKDDGKLYNVTKNVTKIQIFHDTQVATWEDELHHRWDKESEYKFHPGLPFLLNRTTPLPLTANNTTETAPPQILVGPNLDNSITQLTDRKKRDLSEKSDTPNSKLNTISDREYKPYPRNFTPYQFLYVLDPAERPYYGMPRWLAKIFYFFQGMSLTPNLDYRTETKYIQWHANVPSMQLATYDKNNTLYNVTKDTTKIQHFHDSIVTTWSSELHDQWDYGTNYTFHAKRPLPKPQTTTTTEKPYTVIEHVEKASPKILVGPYLTVSVDNSTNNSRRFKRQAPSWKLDISNMTSQMTVGQAYIVKKHHYFKKEVPFSQMFAEISSLQLNLRNMNPTDTNDAFIELQGKTSKFLHTKFPKTFAQNSLLCAEAGGKIVGWSTLVAENIASSLKIVTSDVVRIDKGSISCNIYGQEKIELLCLESIKSIASTTGLLFINTTITEYYQYLLKTYQNKNLFVVLAANRVSLEPDQQTRAICTTPPVQQQHKPDVLTGSVQIKFWNHLSAIYSQILDAYYQSSINLQHLFTLLLETKLPGATDVKNVADICKGVKAMMPTSLPAYSQNRPSDFQSFLDGHRTDSIRITRAFAALVKTTVSLCSSEDNKQQLLGISQTLTTMNINIQNHILSLYKNKPAVAAPQMPKSFALLLQDGSDNQDMYQYLALISAQQLSDQDAIFLYTLLENEKIYAITFLKAFLPSDIDIPKPLQFSNQYLQAKRPSRPSKLYTLHDEINQNNAPRYNGKTQDRNVLRDEQIKQLNLTDQERQTLEAHELSNLLANQATKTANLNQDQTNQPAPPTQQTLQVPTTAKGTRSSTQSTATATTMQTTSRPSPVPHQQIFTPETAAIIKLMQQNNPVVIKQTGPQQTTTTTAPPIRVKRHWWSDMIADLTGLATQDDMQKIDDTEKQIINNEKQIQKEMTNILSKTNSIVASFTEQAEKMSKLYDSEINLKNTLQTIIKDESNTVNKINQLVASLEVMTDVIIEFNSFQGMLSLLPHMIEDIEHAVDSVTSQTLHSTLLPADSIKTLIPYQTKISLLTSSSKAYLTPLSAYV